MTYAELELFYHDILARVRSRGSTCAITSGMACVAYGVAPTTKDCDVLCRPDDADAFRAVVFETKLAGSPPSYRGISRPRWTRAGCAVVGPATSCGKRRRVRRIWMSSAWLPAPARRGRWNFTAYTFTSTPWRK